MTLPEITFGGETFHDMTSIIGPDRYRRPGTIGIGLHHSVGAALFPDLNLNGTNMDEEIAHIKAINAQHLAQGWECGFGYNAIGFDSGRIYVAGDCMGARAHVANRNGELEGICMAGDYRTKKPSAALISGVARYYRARVNVLGVQPIKGHREWAVPGWETSCPGDAGLASVVGAIYTVAVAQEADMDEQQVKALIDRAIDVQVQDEIATPIIARLGTLEAWRAAVVPVIDANTAFRHDHGDDVEVPTPAGSTEVAGRTFLPTPEEIAAAQSGAPSPYGGGDQ